MNKRQRTSTTQEPEDINEDLLDSDLRRSSVNFNDIPTNDFYKKIAHAPTIQPSAEDFNDPMLLWAKLDHLGREYGAIHLKPPDTWKRGFSLDLENLKFRAREQRIDQLFSDRKAFKFPSKTWNGKDFKDYSDQFKKLYKFSTETNSVSTLDDFEREYWHLIETQSTPVKVFYGADLEVNDVGSGFLDPRRSDSDEAHHPWNLLNLPFSKGSLFKHYGLIVPGVTNPWVYVGMLFSTFCWHTEDNYLASVNFQHIGDPKIWYILPPKSTQAMQSLMMKSFSGSRDASEIFHSLSVQIPPKFLAANQIPVYKIVQNANEFVLLWPSAFHAGFNTGFNCNEACNVAPTKWLDYGFTASSAYRFLRHPCISHEQLIYVASAHYMECDLCEDLAQLIQSLGRVISSDYTARKKIDPHIVQLPYHISEVPFSISEDVEQIKSKVKRKNAEYLYTVWNEVLSSPMRWDTDSFLKKIDRVAHLSASNCSECYAASYMAACCCSHGDEVVCLDCIYEAKGYPCPSGLSCKDLKVLYRFPLIIQYRFYALLISRLGEMISKKKLESNQEPHHIDPTKLIKNIPTLYKLTNLEILRAQQYPITSLGFFQTKSNDKSYTFKDAEKPELATLQELSLEIMSQAFADEVCDSSTEAESESHSDEIE